MVKLQRSWNASPWLELYFARNYRRGEWSPWEQERWLLDSDFSIHIALRKFVGDRADKPTRQFNIVVKREEHAPAVGQFLRLILVVPLRLVYTFILVAEHQSYCWQIARPLTRIDEFSSPFFVCFPVRLLYLPLQVPVYCRLQWAFEILPAHRARIMSRLLDTLLALEAEKVATRSADRLSTQLQADRTHVVLLLKVHLYFN